MKNEFADMTLPKNKLFGIYRGIVEDNLDDLKQGRCKIRIFGIHSMNKIKTKTDGIPTDELPWAEPALSLIEGSVDGKGLFSIPLIDSHVFVFFESGNIMHPRYFATVPAKGDWTTKDGGEYSHNIVLETHAGHYCEIDSTPGNERIKIFHKTGTLIEIDNTGNVIANVVSNCNIDVVSNCIVNVIGNCDINAQEANITTNGDTNITAGGICNITGSLINLN